jgi:multidrug efflux pump subunit AcrA (membrane-fusion protein)
MQPSESAGLPAGILEEDLNLDLSAAIQSYQSLITQFDAQRPMAANAIFRAAECYRRLGRMDEARSQYARILREFADQAPLVKLSRKHANPALATASLPADGASWGPQTADETATLERQLAQARNELLKARSELARLLDSVESGVIDRNELLKARSEVAGLRTELKMNPANAPEQRGHGKVYVTGQVVQTGPLKIPEGGVFTVSKAILTAGGFSEFADGRHVRLIRSGPHGQDSKNSQTMVINVAEILEKGETGNDLPVQADDVIYVPKRTVSF